MVLFYGLLLSSQAEQRAKSAGSIRSLQLGAFYIKGFLKGSNSGSSKGSQKVSGLRVSGVEAGWGSGALEVSSW